MDKSVIEEAAKRLGMKTRDGVVLKQSASKRVKLGGASGAYRGEKTNPVPGANRGNDPLASTQQTVIIERAPGRKSYGDIPVGTLTDWDVGTVKNALDAHERGSFYQTAMLSDYMLRDDRIASTMRTRVQGVTGCKRRIQPADGDGGKKAAKAFEADHRRCLPIGAEFAMRSWAVKMGFALGEIVWDTSDANKWVPRDIRVWHPFAIYYDIIRRCYVVSTMEGPVEVRPGDGRWFLYAPTGGYRGWMDGVVRCCAIPFLLRQYGLRDWGRYSEVHGLPTRVGHVPANADPKDKDRFLYQLANLANETTLLLPEAVGDQASFRYELVEASAGNWQAFSNLIIRAEVGITLAILSQNLTSEVQGGAFAAAFIHNEVRQDVKDDDNESFAVQYQEQVGRPWAQYNFGNPDVAPMVDRVVAQPEDKAMAATTLAAKTTALATFATALAALTSMGLKIKNLPEFAKSYGVELEGDPQKPAAPAPPGGGLSTGGDSAGDDATMGKKPEIQDTPPTKLLPGAKPSAK